MIGGVAGARGGVVGTRGGEAGMRGEARESTAGKMTMVPITWTQN